MKTGPLLPAITILSPGCYPLDTVTSTYGTLPEAHADRLFVRGWLLDILPPSSHRTSNNLARNTSTGEFSFAQAEALCRAEGLLALRLEVNDDNERARGIYERAGYRAHPRRLMTLWLDAAA
ncbi:hypothetical protein [Lysobacter sp. Root667]|uniref:GNAT family N-acetyltransferase n=1 Tax=Lysobacter sp. Root667 TaxID=1736581 RepID=UPI000B0DA26A|nr:hypothetical protein [Lysobacter sp. Root667]